MTRILAVHSHSGGTGKSNIAANIAALMAQRGAHVCMVDTDLQSPGLHVLFGLDVGDRRCTLGDYLLGRCEMDEVIHDVTGSLGPGVSGQLSLVPGRPDVEMIVDMVGQGYDAGLLDEGIRWLVTNLAPDVLILDTHSGMTNETLVALAIADGLAIVMRADEKEYQGAQVTSAVTRRLSCPNTIVVVNMLEATAAVDEIRRRARDVYSCEVGAIIPYSTDVAKLGSCSLFTVNNPDHEVTGFYQNIADQLLGAPVQQ